MLLANGEGWHDTKLADLDGDGDLDALQHPSAWDAPRIDVWLNNGTGRVPPWTPKVASTAETERFPKPVGMELWTFRRGLKQYLPATLAMLSRLGFRDIETANLYERDSVTFRKMLDSTGISCSSFIAGYYRLSQDFAGVISDAKNLGARYIVTSGMPHGAELTEAGLGKPPPLSTNGVRRPGQRVFSSATIHTDSSSSIHRRQSSWMCSSVRPIQP